MSSPVFAYEQSGSLSGMTFGAPPVSSPQAPAATGPQVPSGGYPAQIASSQLSYALMNAVFRNGWLYTSHTIGINGRCCIRWYKWAPHVLVLYAGDVSDPTYGRSYYYPSVAVDNSGNVVIGCTGSSANDWASTYYCVHNASDPGGTISSPILLHSGLDYYYYLYDPSQPANRWGDFSHTCVDPVNDSFWTVQEYSAGYSAAMGHYAWGTWWNQIG